MSIEKRYNTMSGYKDFSFIKDLTGDEIKDTDVTLVIRENGYSPLHIRLDTTEVAYIIKGFNWSPPPPQPRPSRRAGLR